MESNNPYDTTPHQSSSYTSPTVGLRSVRIKRIDILSAATISGALYVFIGLVVGGFMCLFALLGVAVGGGGGQAVAGGLIGGIGALIGLPILYGVIGFVGGLIFAVLYNLVAAVVGGVRVDLEG